MVHSVILVPLGVISSCAILQLRIPISNGVSISAVVGVLTVRKHSILIIHILTFLVVAVICQFIQFGDNVIQLLKGLLIGLIANRGRIGVAIATRHSCRLTHGISHCHLALLNVLVLVLLIQSIPVEIVGEFLSVKDLVDSLIQLRLPLRLILSRLSRHMFFKSLQGCFHNIALYILAGFVCRVVLKRFRGCFRSVALLEAGTTFSAIRNRCTKSAKRLPRRRPFAIETCRSYQRRPCVISNNAIHVKIVILLVIFYRSLCLRPVNSVLCQVIATNTVEKLLNLLCGITLRTNLKQFFNHLTISSCNNVLCPIVDISIDPFDRCRCGLLCRR